MALVLVSGGLDSVTLIYYLKKVSHKKDLQIIFFDYNQRAYPEERYCISMISQILKVPVSYVDFGFLSDFSTSMINNIGGKEGIFNKENLENVKDSRDSNKIWWVPARNSLFLLASLAKAESIFIKERKCNDIYIGLKSEGSAPMKDTTQEFIKEINKLVYYSVNSGKFRFIAPFIDKDKDEIIKIGDKLGLPFHFTYSCYISNGFQRRNKVKIPIHCGQCSNCLQRKKAFYWANVQDPSVYLK